MRSEKQLHLLFTRSYQKHPSRKQASCEHLLATLITKKRYHIQLERKACRHHKSEKKFLVGNGLVSSFLKKFCRFLWTASTAQIFLSWESFVNSLFRILWRLATQYLLLSFSLMFIRLCLIGFWFFQTLCLCFLVSVDQKCHLVYNYWTSPLKRK